MEYATQCMNMCVVNTRYSADSDGPVLLATLWRLGRPDSVSCMLCGVIFGWAKSPGLPTVTSCEMKTRALVQILPAGRKRLFSVAFGPGRAGVERSSDRLLTFGVNEAGRQAAPRAGPEWQARRGRELSLPGVGPAAAAAPLRARSPDRSQMPQAGARTRPAVTGRRKPRRSNGRLNTAPTAGGVIHDRHVAVAWYRIRPPCQEPSRPPGSCMARPPTMVKAGVSSARSSGSAASGSVG